MLVYALFSALIVWLLGKCWQYSLVKSENAWPTLRLKARKPWHRHWLSWLERWFLPGWTVRTFSFPHRIKQLNSFSFPLTVDQFYSLKQFLFATGGVGLLLWLWFGTWSFNHLVIYTLTWLVWFSVPELYALSFLAQKRKTIEREVPYFLDLLTLSLQSGGNIEQALLLTTRNYQSLLSLIVGKKLRELHWGRSLEGLLIELKEEIHHQDFNHFIDSVVRAKTLGVSLRETLVIQGRILRTRRRQRAEELSRTASVKISLPLVLFIFPALLIIYIGPGILQLMART